MEIQELKIKANKIRKNIIIMLNKAGSGHSAGALGLADIFACLYFKILNHNPKKPNDKNRDYLILSNGHTCPVLYSTLAEAGYFKKEELDTLRQIGSNLQGHPHNTTLAGIENSSGPLGQGISQAVGLAVSLKRDKKNNKVFCIIGDGEMQEGQVWEAIMFAAKEKLDNLYLIIDRNYIQIDGNTESVCVLDSINSKMKTFNFKTYEFDGNSIAQILYIFNMAFKQKGKPICLIANTKSGKGIDFIEGDYHWHGKVPNDNETKIALEQLNKI